MDFAGLVRNSISQAVSLTENEISHNVHGGHEEHKVAGVLALYHQEGQAKTVFVQLS
jgi:hypothetical protein